MIVFTRHAQNLKVTELHGSIDVNILLSRYYRKNRTLEMEPKDFGAWFFLVKIIGTWSSYHTCKMWVAASAHLTQTHPRVRGRMDADCLTTACRFYPHWSTVLTRSSLPYKSCSCLTVFFFLLLCSPLLSILQVEALPTHVPLNRGYYLSYVILNKHLNVLPSHHSSQFKIEIN